MGLTRSLAVELAPEAIRVNAIAPGFVESEMSDRLRQFLTEEQFAAIRKNHPLDIGRVRDVANGAAFLLSSASRWITGITLPIDGGYTAH
jgi:NAD(P)-dependent dehydrogenase (short-subunit alcohol dehydrogenase family)